MMAAPSTGPTSVPMPPMKVIASTSMVRTSDSIDGVTLTI